jgi:hypothetical protein
MPYDLLYGQFEHKKKSFLRGVFLMIVGGVVVYITHPKKGR